MQKNYRRGQLWVSAVILRKIGSMMYIVELNDETRWKSHVNQLKKRYSEENTSLDQESGEIEDWGPPPQNTDTRITTEEVAAAPPESQATSPAAVPSHRSSRSSRPQNSFSLPP